MKIRSTLLLALISIVVSLFGAGLGAVSGAFLYAYYIPPWKHYEISSFQGAKDILQIDIQSSLEDPTEDTLYVVSENGKVFSNTLFRDSWNPVESLPENNYEFPLCATAWQEHPPIQKGLVDSAGVRFERPLSTILRCYVLFKDGRLQVWTRSTNVFSLMNFVSASAILGLFAGIIASVFVRRRLRKPTSIIKDNAS